ncbi:MAG: DUF6108 family protein [Bacteroidales bacterium]
MRIKIFIILLLSGLSMYAQTDLTISCFFDGRFNKSDKAVVTLLKGKKLIPYNLSLFHSISLENSPDEIQKFEKAVMEDKKKAKQIELINADSKVMACYLQLPPVSSESKQNRFILYRSPTPDQATLIYMEGDTDLDSLIKIFITKKK